MSSKSFFCPIHREGYIFIAIAIVFTFLCSMVIEPVAWISAIITGFIIYFFRDPNRVTPEGKDLVISPADGVIQKIEDALPPEELELPNKSLSRISVFLDVMNVHVNRVPIAGKITGLNYRSGKFFNASLDKASSENERQSSVVTTENGDNIVFVQIAGLIAKRIICDLEVGQEVTSGAKFGIIRFGSRMDIYLPKHYEINAIEGQTMIGGETILAKAKTKPAAKTTKKTTNKIKKPVVK
jgi:phosphatidylserine decarboxylase